MYFWHYLLLKKGLIVHLKNLSTLYSTIFEPSLVEIGPVVLEKKVKM